jgi:hypothetical protein
LAIMHMVYSCRCLTAQFLEPGHRGNISGFEMALASFRQPVVLAYVTQNIVATMATVPTEPLYSRPRMRDRGERVATMSQPNQDDCTN